LISSYKLYRTIRNRIIVSDKGKIIGLGGIFWLLIGREI